MRKLYLTKVGGGGRQTNLLPVILQKGGDGV